MSAKILSFIEAWRKLHAPVDVALTRVPFSTLCPQPTSRGNICKKRATWIYAAPEDDTPTAPMLIIVGCEKHIHTQFNAAGVVSQAHAESGAVSTIVFHALPQQCYVCDRTPRRQAFAYLNDQTRHCVVLCKRCDAVFTKRYPPLLRDPRADESVEEDTAENVEENEEC